MEFSEKSIYSVVYIIKSFLVLVCAAIIVVLIFQSSSLPMAGILWVGFIDTVSFLGLHLRKPWVIPLMIGMAVFGFFNALRLFAVDAIDFYIKVSLLALALFQLYFFTRNEVRRYFHFQWKLPII